MPIIVNLQSMEHGSHFHASALRAAPESIAPFLGVDHAWMSAPTFPPHPHRAISAVSYPFLDSETAIANHDSIGNHNLIQPGGVHWAMAGSGIVHEEVPAETGKTVHQLQIFVNLSAANKALPPSSLSLEPGQVPVVQLPDATVRVPLGEFANVHSPLEPVTPVTLLDISLEAGATLHVPIPAGHNAFVMPINGVVWVDGAPFSLEKQQLPVYPANRSAQELVLTAQDGAAQVVVFSGAPV